MKKLFILSIFLCFALFLFGCEQSATENTDTVTNDTTTSSVSADENADTDTESETTADAPTDDEVASAYDAAYIIYQWFDLNPLTVETDSDGNVIFYTVGDNDYCEKVDDPAVSSMDDLKSQVNKYFSADLAATMLDGGKYFEDNGILYEIASDRGADITRGDVLSESVTDRSDTSITFTVTVETVNPETGASTGSENVDNIYELVDGSWIFTTFHSIY